MSDFDDISKEELEAEKAMEKDQPSSSDEEAESADEKEEKKPKQQTPRDDSDDDMSDEGKEMEDNEEKSSPPGSPEPSDADDLDEAEERSVGSTEEEKRLRKHAALQFLDLEADVKTEKGIIKHCRKKFEEDADQYEMDSIMDGEDEITYESDFTEGQRKRKKPAKEKERKKAKKDEAAAAAAAAASDSDDDLVLIKKAHAAKQQAAAAAVAAAAQKQRRIKKIASSSSDMSDEEEEEEDDRKKPTTHVVADEDLENMTVLNGTHSQDKINGTVPRKKAGFHDLGDIARALKEKKNKAVDPGSLLDSPKKEKKEKKASSAAAAGGASPSSSAKKTPAPKKPKASKPQHNVGEIFELFKKVWKVTYRGLDTPMEMGPNGQYSYIANLYHPDQFTTCQLLEVAEGGAFKETNTFEHFLTSPDRKPKKICPKYAINGWNDLNTQTDKQAHAYAIQAIENNNFVVDAAAGTKRMMFIPKLFEQITKEAYRDENGEVGWMPKNIKLREHTTNYNIKGEVVDKKGKPIPEEGSATPNPASAASSSSSAKKSPVKPKKEQKPKIDKVKEKDSHDITKMLKHTPTTAAPSPARALPPPPPSTPSSSTKSLLSAANLFNDDDDNNAVDKENEPAFLWNNNNGHGFLKQLMTNYIDIGVKKNNTEAIRDRFKEVADTMDEAAKIENPAARRKFVTEKYGEGVAVAMHLFPFLNTDAAKIVREKIKM